jgi:hypothetical protein
MDRRPIAAATVLRLIAVVLVLPMATVMIVGVAVLLSMMGDAAGGKVLGYIALGCGIAWAIGLVCLVVVQALNALGDGASSDRSPHSVPAEAQDETNG